ncbi:MAG: methylated-DNA--[protein]-cysteine S-methyltransferase [Chloroflexi bacterium]|nr:methylated-DNA--[protein]-cysteine S-methyltransferase [Chloroflexota bacterium]
MSRLWYDVFPTRLGWVAALASERGLRATSLPSPTPERALERLGPELHMAAHSPGDFTALRKALEAYFDGEPLRVDTPLDMEGVSPFFHKAWETCRSIPAGQTRSYAWLARSAGRPGAARAAGQAMARNRFPLLVPCHRVVGSDGTLHGFGGGLEMKAALLQLEEGHRKARVPLGAAR